MTGRGARKGFDQSPADLLIRVTRAAASARPPQTVEALGMNRLRLSARPLTFLTEILQMEPMMELSARLRLPLLAANGKRQHRRGPRRGLRHKRAHRQASWRGVVDFLSASSWLRDM